MNQKTIIKDNDYNYFLFPLVGVHFLFSKSRIEQFILGELEKEYPFFGTHCSVDIHVCVKKLRCVALVFVIDTICLETYKNHSKKNILYAYSGNGSSKSLRKVFFDRNSRKKILIALSCLFALTFVIPIFSTFFYPQNIEGEIIHDPSFTPLPKENISVQVFLDNIQTWTQSNVLCTSFYYSRVILPSGYEAQIDIQVTLLGLYPEEIFSRYGNIENREAITPLNEIQIGSISFEENVPRLTVTYSSIELVQSSFEVRKNTVHENTAIRNICIQNSGTILEEVWEDQYFTFNVPVVNWKNAYWQLMQYFEENEKMVANLSLVCEKSSEMVDVEMNIVDGKNFSEMAALQTIFTNQKKHHTELLLAQKESTEHISLVQNVVTEKHVGKIRKHDGSEIVFFENAEGKIIISEGTD